MSNKHSDRASGSCCGADSTHPRGHADDHSSHGHHAHKQRGAKPSPAAKYFCPMCPGVESDKPGDCSKCGMALERNPAWVPPPAGQAIYTFPMHPDVEQDPP